MPLAFPEYNNPRCLLSTTFSGFYVTGLLGVLHNWDRVRRVRLFDTKSAPRISGEPFDVESPIFT